MASWLSTAKVTRYALGSPDRPFPIQDYIDKYSEQVTARPLDDLERYLSLAGMGGVTPGGVPTGSTILAYAPKALRPNLAAISAIGEGLAGWYLEDVEGLSYVARPSGVSPDLIFTDPSSRRFALAEVKTTLRGNITLELKNAGVIVLDVLAKTKLIRRGLYLAYAIGVVIQGVDQYEVHSLRMEEV